MNINNLFPGNNYGLDNNMNQIPQNIMFNDLSNIQNQSRTQIANINRPKLEPNNYKINEFTDKQSKIIENFKIKPLLKNFCSQKKENRKYPKKIDINCPLFKKNNFILSPKALEKCNKVYHYMIYQVPCILEGETGTSKSFTASMMAQYRQWQIIEEEKKRGRKNNKYTEFKLIKFSLSKETKISDLFGKYSGSGDSLDGIKMTYGPFIEAFRDGHCLLLDEINLAPTSVLQSIEEALDTGILSLEMTGIPLEKFKMHPNFCLIATQNKRTKFYKNKRESAGIKFLSKFQIVYFEELSRDELIKIAKGLRDNFSEEKGKGIIISDEDIEKLVDFHIEWNKSKENDFICFTIRQIYSCIKAYFKGENMYNIIYNIYGKTHEQLEKFESTIQKYFPKNDIILDLPKEFPSIFPTNSLKKIFHQVIFSFLNGSNVIITGKKGCGKTQFALCMAEYYNKIYGNKELTKEEIEDIDFMICTEQTSCNDIIGKQILSQNEESGLTMIKWKYGFLLEGIKKGKCIILDNINEIPSQVTERTNNLFDLDFNSKENLYFEIPENPNKDEQKIEIKKSFRVIAISDEDKLNNMSPAFLNRFKIIYFEDQLKDLEQNEFIKFKMDKLEQEKKKLLSTNNMKRMNPRLRKRLQQAAEKQEKEVDEEKEKEKNDFIEELSKKIGEDNKNILFSMSSLSFFIEAAYIFKTRFNKIKSKIIIDYIFQLIDQKNNNIAIDDSIYNEIKRILSEYETDNREYNNSKINNYFFSNSKELCSFMINAYSSYLIHMHMRFEGPTGIGKTVGACALARIITKNKKYYIQSFHSGTKPSQCYGGTTVIGTKIDIKDGLLTQAMNEGSVFIADEFNLSSKETMKSILPSLSRFNNYKIYIPGLEKKIKINQNFIFIACQNKVGTLGRNKLPDLIEDSLREFVYPSHIKKTNEEIKEIENDVKNICSKINNSLIKENTDVSNPIEDIEAKQIGVFMLKFNQLNKNYIQPLSFRDIKKIFRRIYYQRNKSKKDIFIGFEVHHNIIFYILSKLNKQNITDIKDDLLKLIDDIFISKKEKDLNVYFENKLKLTGEKKNIFLIKGLCQVNLSLNFTEDMKKKLFSYINLENFLNPFFNAIISSNDESLLFIGKTSCKTFLCKTLFLDELDVIHLNQETKINQLLGGPMVLSKKEAKIFYFNYLCNLCGKSKNINELFNEYENNNLKSYKFNVSSNLKGFEYAVKNFKKILFDNKQNLEQKDNEDNFLSNYIIVFKPGFILDSLIKDKPFVLKDISNLHSDVLERFNQFLTEEQKIILNEDIYNTFTDDENKEIAFNCSNRILATANDGYENKLSEAILSRFTVINVESYELEEEKLIIKMEFDNPKFNSKKEIEEVEQLIKLFREIESILQMAITLSQKIKILKIIYKLKELKEIEENENINLSEIVLFNLFKGLFEFRTHKSKRYKSFINLFKCKNLWNYEEDKSTLFKEEKNKRIIIKSHNTHLYVERPNSKENPIEDIAFTEKFCENIDIIHFSIKLNIPLILEGMEGQGKKTALNYIFKLLNINESNIINIYLSDNTKKEDLLGKITATAENNNIKVDFVQTDLLKALINKDGKDYAIIFHNINKASPGIFEILENIFDSSKKSVLLPNGENVEKSKENPPFLFGILDSENGKINKNSLPKFLLRTCIYFIVQNPNGGDIHKIITSKFNQKPYKLEANYFEDKFLIASNIQNNYSSSNNDYPLSLNDINKFISFRDKTYKNIDISIISQFIFVYRHTENEKIQEIIKDLKFKAFNFIPKFSFEKEKLIIEIEEKEKENDKDNQILSLDYNKYVDTKEIVKRLNTLTKPQKHCLLFLSCSILSDCSIILQGNTNSGKTHLINLFANMLGKKLHVYQMNKDINLSMFFGQSSIRELNKREKNNINALCKNLAKLIGYNNDFLYWNPDKFNELYEAFQNYPNTAINYNEAKEIYNLLKESILITKRFELKKSAFCEALERGDWILIEQIESAPTDIIEKLIPLCGDNPELKIIKGTEEITYKRSNKFSYKIDKNFRIFFTFNPYNRETKIHPSLFSKCIVFTLPQIDSTSEYCSKIYYGKLINTNYPVGLSYDISNITKQLSGRLSKTHKIAKENAKNYEIENKNITNKDEIFTGRTIKFISNEITNIEKNEMKNDYNITQEYLNDIIHSTFEHYYTNSFDNSQNQNNFKKFEDSLIDAFCQEPEKFETDDEGFDALYIDIVKDCELIKKFSQNDFEKEDEKKEFSLSNLINKTISIKIKHLANLLKYIKNINTDLINKNKNRIFLCKIYQGFKIIIDLLENIDKTLPKRDFYKFSKLSINDSKLLNDKNLKKSTSKFILYNQLLKNKYIISDNLTPDFLINNILNLVKTKSFTIFKTIISYLYKYPNLFDSFFKIFPFNKFIIEKELKGEDGQKEIIDEIKDKSSILVLWFELFYIYWKKKINFIIKIDHSTYKFNFGENNKAIVNPCFIFYSYSRFYLRENSYFNFIDDNEKKEDMHIIEKVSRAESYDFYQYLYKFSDYKKYIPTAEQYEQVYDEFKDETKELQLFKKFKEEEKYFFNINGIFNEINEKKKYNEDFDDELIDKNNDNYIKDDNIQEDNHISPITKILSLYFNYSKDIFEPIMREYFNPIEKKIYKLLLEDFDEKLDKNDYLIYSDIIGRLDKFFYNYIYLFDENKIEKSLNNAKERNLLLTNVNKALDNITENQNKFINFDFEPLLIDLKNLKKKILEINDKQENENEKQLIIDSLNDYKNTNNEKLIENAKNRIKNLEGNMFKNWKNTFHKPKNKDKIKTYDWPKINFVFEGNYSNKDFNKHKTFIDVLLKFCEIKNIMDEKMDDEGKRIDDFFELLIQLSEYEEMRNVSSYVFNKIGNDFSIGPKEIQILKCALNASFLKNLIDYCYIKEKNKISFKIIDEMFSYFNNLVNRKIEKNEIIYFMNNYSSKYKPNFKISFPKFTGMDLIYLFVDFNNNSEVVNSLLIENVKIGQSSLERLVNIETIYKEDDFNSYLNIIVKILFEKVKKINYENNYDFLKELLKTEDELEIKNLCKLLISFYDEKELNILKRQHNFNLEEIDIYKFLDNNQYLEKIKFFKIPSLIYFLLDYKFDSKNILIGKYDENTNVENSKEYIPFWLLCLRYFSSIECIISKENNFFSRIIDKFFRNYFSSKKIVKLLDSNWLNFITSNKTYNYEPLYEKIKLFLYKLSKDEYFLNLNNSNYINKQIIIICNDFISNMLENLFEKKMNNYTLMNYYNEKNSNNIKEFLKNPNKYLYDKLTENLTNNLSKEIDSESNLNAINRIIANIRKVLDFKEENIKKDILKELEIKNKKNNELNVIKNKEKKEKNLKALNEDLNQYNKLIETFQNDENEDIDEQSKLKELIKLNDILNRYNKLFKKEEKSISITKISYSLDKKRNHIIKNSDGEIIYESTNLKGVFYLHSNNQDYSIVDKKDDKPIVNINIIDKTEIVLNQLKFIKNMEKNYDTFYIETNEDNIILIFGNNITNEKFFEKVITYKKELKKIEECFSTILNKKDLILNCRLDKINKKVINKFIKICNVKFSDEKKCEKISDSLQDIKKDLEQINTDYNFISEKFKEIYEQLDIINGYKEKILKNDYELKDITSNKIINKNIMDFSEIKENSILSLPIINVDSQKEEIFCSYKELNIDIEPFYPSLYLDPYKISITTISNLSLLINIKPIEQYIHKIGLVFDSAENLINYNKNVESNRPIEMQVNIPQMKELFIYKEIHCIKFYLEIICQNEKKNKNNNNNKKPFRLPININMTLMSIIIKIITKNKKIEINNNNLFINKDLYSGEEIVFYLQQLNLDLKKRLKPYIQIEGFKGNNSNPPDIGLSKEDDKDNDKVTLIIPDNGNQKYHLKMNVNIFYTEDVKFSIYINSDIYNFDYYIKPYDIEKKEFSEGDLILKYNYLEQLDEKKILKLYIKYVYPEGLNEIYFAQIDFENNYEDFITITNMKESSQFFENINNNYILELDVEIDKAVFEKNNEPKIIVKSEIKGIVKETSIIFINEDNDIALFDEYEIKNDKELEEQEKTYYFIENQGILPELNNKQKNTFNIINKEEKEIEIMKEINDIKIEIPELIEPKTPYSFQDLDDFYSLCIKIIRTLPSYIQYSLKNKNKKNLEKAKNIFLQIFGYYRIFPLNQKDNSFLHEKINLFKSSFKDLVKKLYNSGLKIKKSNLGDLYGINEIELNDDNIQSEYIIYPNQRDIDIPSVINEQYLQIEELEEEDKSIKSKKSKRSRNYLTECPSMSRSNFFNLSQYERGNFLRSKNIEITPENDNDIDNLNIPNYQNNNENNDEETEINDNNINEYPFEKMKNYKKEINPNNLEEIYLGNKEYNQRREEAEKNEENLPNNNINIMNNNGNQIIGYVINENVSKTFEIAQEQFEDYKFDEKSGIQYVLKKIDKLEQNNELNILNTQGYLPKSKYIEFNNENHKYKILELSSHILKLASKTFNDVCKLIGPDIKADVPFKSINIILLIDGSSYISNKRKIINFHILCSYAVACHLLEIPYGIAVVADGKFKIIIKQFEEPHSFEILEKVYECLKIRRFRDNLSNSQKFAKESFMFSVEYNQMEKNQIPEFFKAHPKKIIITITDGLDEELKLTKSWNNLIFNEPDVSFGFIFNKPDFGNDEDKKKIEKLWENFIEESKKAKSKVIVHIFEKEIKNNFYDGLSEFFRNLIFTKMEYLKEDKAIKYDIKIHKPIFIEENIILSSMQDLTELSFKGRRNKYINSQLYIQNYPLKFYSDGIFKEEVADYDKNKLGKICRGSVEKDIEKEFQDFIDKFIIKYKDIDRMSLDKIFKKNKASQKVLSTTGSEIDIISLVISILNKEPRPKIFWEEQGEMKRQYSVSIIIDNSISCFGDISRGHSFKIIRELLSPLSYLDISKLDVILTTNDSPIILCSDIESQKCLRNDSTFWIGLFNYLLAPYYGCDLSSAINFAYNLNKERNEYTKRIFVLTDGLYERKEQLYISKQIHNCTQLDMNIIGIGIGSNPIGIENIFEKIIYTIEPSNLLLGLSGFFEQIHVTTTEKMNGYEFQANELEIKNIVKKLASDKKIYFKDLNKELKKIEVNYTTFEYFNRPVPLDKHFTNLNEAKNPEENEETLMLKKGVLKGQKILIVMLWSYIMNKSSENEEIIPDNLFRSKKMNQYLDNIENIQSKPCVESAVDIFGLKIYVVLDYESAIKELTKNVNGKCDYNSVWIMCGPQKAVLPNPKSDPNLIGEFMNVINMFWMNGGSLVFFADGDPLFYQVNLFLKNAEFPLDEDDNNYNENDFNMSKRRMNKNEYDQDSYQDSEENSFKNSKKDEINSEENEEEDEENEIREKEKSISNKIIDDNEDEEDDEEINPNNIILEEKEERIKKEKINKIKVNFRIKGSHKGTKTLIRDNRGFLDKNMRFNAVNNVISNLKRPNIGTNLIKIFEGVTISYASDEDESIYFLFSKLGLGKNIAKEKYNEHYRKNKNNPIYPFIPFARDSEGGISIMIYYGIGCGDVVIDCGFTKCFLEMEEEGTLRYIRNLSAVTSRCDVLMKEGNDPQTWKPDLIDYKLDLSKKYFWEEFNRKVYIIDVDKPVTKGDKLYIYETISGDIYSEYNNIIYFYNNGITKIKLEDIKKENSLIPTINKQTNMKQIAEDIIKECNEKFGNNYYIEIFSDGFCKEGTNKLMDYILSNNGIDFNRRTYQLLPEADIQISAEFTQNTLDDLINIKTYEELIARYRDIRNSLIFLPYQYIPDISAFQITSELERINQQILENLKDDESKNALEEKMKVLLFYSNLELDNLGGNTAAFKSEVKIEEEK